ncbi:MAG TPA: N-carbamoylputrescine amidase [Kofleriaceae bacterium]|nr:N-carbamoylputrescine amidase [Kofleriaceae bacterium]
MTLTVAAVQSALSDDAGENLERMTRAVREAAARGAKVILLPELFEGHYFPQTQREEDFSRARPAKDHPTLAALSALARAENVVIPASFFERDGPAFYNSVAIIDADGTILGTYRKSHIPDGPGYQEKFFFRPGDTGFAAWTTRYGTIGVGICWDQWFPEAARAMVLAGAEILLYPTAIGSEPEAPDIDTRDPWRRVMIGHAVANAVPVIAANRTGREGGLAFYGSSFVADHRGEIVAEAARENDAIVIADVDLDAARRWQASFGFFRDRRPELYESLAASRSDPRRGRKTPYT